MTSSNNSNNGNGSGNGSGSPFGVSNPSPTPRLNTTPQQDADHAASMRSMFGDTATQAPTGSQTPFSDQVPLPPGANRGYSGLPPNSSIANTVNSYMEAVSGIVQDIDAMYEYGRLDGIDPLRENIRKIANNTAAEMLRYSPESYGSALASIGFSGLSPTGVSPLIAALVRQGGSTIPLGSSGVGQMPLSEYLAEDAYAKLVDQFGRETVHQGLPSRDAFMRRLESLYPEIGDVTIPTVDGEAYAGVAASVISRTQHNISALRGMGRDERVNLVGAATSELDAAVFPQQIEDDDYGGQDSYGEEMSRGIANMNEFTTAIATATDAIRSLAVAAGGAGGGMVGGGGGGGGAGGGGVPPTPPSSMPPLGLPSPEMTPEQVDEAATAIRKQDVRNRRFLDRYLRARDPETDEPIDVSTTAQRLAGFAQGFFGGQIYVTDTEDAQRFGMGGRATRTGLNLARRVYDKYGEVIRGSIGEMGGGGIAGSIEADILYRGGYLNYFNNAYQVRQQGLRNTAAATSFVGAVGAVNEVGNAFAGAMQETLAGGQQFSGLELPMLQAAGSLGYGAYSTMRPFQGMKSINGRVLNYGTNTLGADILRTSQTLGVGASKAAEYIAGVAQAGMLSGVGNPFSARAGQAELLNTGLIASLVQGGYDPGAVAQLQAGNALSGGGNVSVLLNAAQQTGYRGATAMALTSAVYGATQQRMLSGLSPRSAEKVMAMAQSAGAGNELFALSAVSKSDQLGLGSMQAGLSPLGGLAAGAAMAYAMERTGGDMGRAGAMVSEMGAGGHLAAMRRMGIDDPSLRSAALYARGMTPREISAAIKAGNAKAVEGELSDTPADTSSSMGASREFARQTVSNAQTFGAGRAAGQTGDTPIENLGEVVSGGITFNEQLIKESRIQSGQLRALAGQLASLNGFMRKELKPVFDTLNGYITSGRGRPQPIKPDIKRLVGGRN